MNLARNAKHGPFGLRDYRVYLLSSTSATRSDSADDSLHKTFLLSKIYIEWLDHPHHHHIRISSDILPNKTSTMSPRFGYIGLGNMGVPIVRNLAKYAAASGFPSISIWNRSSAKYALVKDAIPDAFYADNVEDVVLKSDIVLSSLIDDKAAEDVYKKMFKATEGRNVIFVDQSSLKAVTSGKHLFNTSFLSSMYRKVICFLSSSQTRGTSKVYRSDLHCFSRIRQTPSC